MRTRRREHERERRAREAADREERRDAETTVADPPQTVDDLLDVLADGDGVTYEEAALVGGIEEAAGGSRSTATRRRAVAGDGRLRRPRPRRRRTGRNHRTRRQHRSRGCVGSPDPGPHGFSRPARHSRV
ncbi:hypothetical protein ACFQFH_18250 [Halobaculum halobium]|uniref:Uncharacterized protein n=1 Tax=Halobaculum halobium TaxID=3032281 RepID=A0ABD5TF65_9EURY|nr:hypothetical protein [Halobaculum sp. SYNS20]